MLKCNLWFEPFLALEPFLYTQKIGRLFSISVPRSIFHSSPSAACLRNVSPVGCIHGLLAVCILIELGRWRLSAQMVQMVLFFFLSPFLTVFSSPAERKARVWVVGCGSFSSKCVAIDEPLSDWVQIISFMESSTRNDYHSHQAVIILLLTLLVHFSSPPFSLIFEDARRCFQNACCVLCLDSCVFFLSKNTVL